MVDSTPPECLVEEVLVTGNIQNSNANSKDQNDDSFEYSDEESLTGTLGSQNDTREDPLLNYQTEISESGEFVEPSGSGTSVDRSVSAPSATDESNISNASEDENLLQTIQDDSLEVQDIGKDSQFSHRIATESKSELAADHNSNVQNDSSTENYAGATDGAASVKTEPILLMEQPESNRSELESLLDEEEQVVDEYDEDIVIIFDRKVGYGKPFKCNTEGLIKYENDAVSGSIPFAATVSNFHKKSFAINYDIYLF